MAVGGGQPGADRAGDGDRGPVLAAARRGSRVCDRRRATGSTSSCARARTRSRAGTTEILKNIVAERVLGLPEAAGEPNELRPHRRAAHASGAARDFLAARLKSEKIRALGGVGRRLRRGPLARDVGAELARPVVSEEHGGQELGTVELAVLMEQLGYALVPGPISLEHARRRSRSRPPAPTSSASATWHRSPPARSAARSRSGTAAPAGRRRTSRSSRENANGGYVLNGEKLFVLDAATADFLIVGATDGRRFIVDRDADGVSVDADADDRLDSQAVRGQARRRAGRTRTR